MPRQLEDFGQSMYLIQARNSADSWVRLTEDFFVSTTLPPASDHSVLGIDVLETPELLNRWSTALIQSEQIRFGSNFELHKPIHARGITGKGVIVTVVDSGLDYANCFFRDDRRPAPINRTDFLHRKIVRYEAIGDETDSRGHGTHVAGILTGNANCAGCEASRFNCHAPDSKLLFVDIDDIHSLKRSMGNTTFLNILQQAKACGSRIISNSWGYRPGKNALRAAFDRIAFENPEFILVFWSWKSRNQTIDLLTG
jgi:subtilisin family serine protease